MSTKPITWISVLLCTYNDEKFISETIQSILGQSYPYFEFIIINDGSTDDTEKIINRYKDSRIKYISKINTGLTDSLNYGLKYCTYDWIARIDGDDIAHIDKFKKQIEYIKDDVAAIGTQYECIDCYGKIINKINLPTSHKQIVKRGIIGGTMLNHPSVLINKKILNKVDNYDKFIEAAEDLDLWLKLSTYGKLVNINHILLKYRIHGSNISITKRETQYINAQVAILKYRSKINRNITDFEYSQIREKLEKNHLFHIGKFLNSKSISAKGLDLKFINFAFRINQILINIFIKKITNG